MENLGIDPKLLIAQLINFVLFFFIFKKYMAKPFGNFLKGEAKKDQEKEKFLKEAKESEEKYNLKLKDEEKKIKKQEALVLESAKSEAKKIKEGLVDEARKEIEAMKISARKAIEAEKNKSSQEIEKKVAELTNLVIGNSLKNYLNEETSRQLTGNMLRNLGSELAKYESS